MTPENAPTPPIDWRKRPRVQYRRTHLLVIRLSQPETDQIRQACLLTGETLSGFVRASALEAAEQIAADAKRS